MSWVEPKINWVNFDYFTHDDWNRISGNVEVVTDLLISGGLPIDEFTPVYMLPSGYPYRDLANKISEQINTMIYLTGITFDEIKLRNSAECVWDSADLNNIEGVLLEIYNSYGSGRTWQEIYDTYTWNSAKTITWSEIRNGGT